MQSKRRNQYQSDNRETNDKTKPFINFFHIAKHMKETLEIKKRRYSNRFCQSLCPSLYRGSIVEFFKTKGISERKRGNKKRVQKKRKEKIVTPLEIEIK